MTILLKHVRIAEDLGRAVIKSKLKDMLTNPDWQQFLQGDWDNLPAWASKYTEMFAYFRQGVWARFTNEDKKELEDFKYKAMLDEWNKVNKSCLPELKVEKKDAK